MYRIVHSHYKREFSYCSSLLCCTSTQWQYGKARIAGLFLQRSCLHFCRTACPNAKSSGKFMLNHCYNGLFSYQRSIKNNFILRTVSKSLLLILLFKLLTIFFWSTASYNFAQFFSFMSSALTRVADHFQNLYLFLFEQFISSLYLWLKRP